MPIGKQIPVTYKPGTTKSPQLTKLNSAAFTDTQNVHFPDGVLRTVPAWKSFGYEGAVSVMGMTRTIFKCFTTKEIELHCTHSGLYALISGTMYNITPLQTTSTPAPNSIATTSGSPTIVITSAGHGLTVGQRVGLSGAASSGGIPAASINGEAIIVAVTASSFSVNARASATTTLTGQGGSSFVYYKPIAPGFIDVSLGEGFGGGSYGVGLYGVSKAFGNTYRYPRIWSVDVFGDDIVLCPGDMIAGDGQKIYIWDGNPAIAPTVIPNAPAGVNYVYVMRSQVHAVIGNRIQTSIVGDATSWPLPSATNNAYLDDVERVSRFISRGSSRDISALYTPDEVYSLQYSGDPDWYDIKEAYTADGILGPNARTKIGETEVFMGHHGLYTFDGATVQKLQNDQNEDWIFENLNASQAWKTFLRADTKNGQFTAHFPIGSSSEPNCYVIGNPGNGSWTLGMRSLTAAQQRELGSSFRTANGNASGVATIFTEEVSNPALDLQAYAQLSYAYAGTGQQRFRTQEMLPDANIIGSMTVRVDTREYAQSVERVGTTKVITPNSPKATFNNAAGRARSLRFGTNGPGTAFTLGAWSETIQLQGQR